MGLELKLTFSSLVVTAEFSKFADRSSAREARRGSQGASRAAPGKSGLPARGEGERVLALESREGKRASRRVEDLRKV